MMDQFLRKIFTTHFFKSGLFYLNRKYCQILKDFGRFGKICSGEIIVVEFRDLHGMRKCIFLLICTKFNKYSWEGVTISFLRNLKWREEYWK